jgi:hypothetical protein
MTWRIGLALLQRNVDLGTVAGNVSAAYRRTCRANGDGMHAARSLLRSPMGIRRGVAFRALLRHTGKGKQEQSCE